MRQLLVECLVELLDVLCFLEPCLAIDGQQFLQNFLRQVQTGQIQRIGRRYVTDGGGVPLRLAATAGQDPLQRTEVLAVAGP